MASTLRAEGAAKLNGERDQSQIDERNGVGLSRSELLTAAEVAELLQLRPSTVQDYARRGIIPSFKLGRFRRFVRADVEATLELLRESGGYPSPR